MGKLYLGTQEITPFVYDGEAQVPPLDPKVVYRQARPADWLPMPTPVNNEIYLLVKVPVPNQEKDSGIPLAFLCQTTAGQYQVELGTVTNGTFVADSTYTTLLNSNRKYTNYLYYSDWTDSPMDDGTHQVMVKISTVSGNLSVFRHYEVISGNIYGNQYTLELRGHCEQMTTCAVSGTGNLLYPCNSMQFYSLEGTNNITSFSNMFYNCYSLTAIPALDTSSGTNFTQMFYGCYSLTAIPLLDTSSGTNFTQMFYGCYSLTAIPALDTSSGTSFSNMFYGCYSLTAIPALDTSSGTYFSNMFYGCYSLTAIPALDTSSGTSFSNMFYGCFLLRYIDFVGYDFTNVTSANNRPTNTSTNGGGIMRIDNKFQMSTGGFTGVVINAPQGASATNPFYILIEDDQTMVPLGANATTVFTTNQYTYVVVPDSMYATYAADTYWATLNTRLKRRSDVTLPDWYTN